jgi:hypothetical protein
MRFKNGASVVLQEVLLEIIHDMLFDTRFSV